MKSLALAVIVFALPCLSSASERSMGTSPAPLRDAIWSPTHFPKVVTQTKFAAEDLLYEFGNQPFVSQGANKKGAPITVRLTDVDVPPGIEGVDSELLFTRFFWFTRGNSDVAIGRNAKRSDLNLTMRVVATIMNGQRALALRLEARAAQGRAKGKLLFMKSRLLQ